MNKHFPNAFAGRVSLNDLLCAELFLCIRKYLFYYSKKVFSCNKFAFYRFVYIKKWFKMFGMFLLFFCPQQCFPVSIEVDSIFCSQVSAENLGGGFKFFFKSKIPCSTEGKGFVYDSNFFCCFQYLKIDGVPYLFKSVGSINKSLGNGGFVGGVAINPIINQGTDYGNKEGTCNTDDYGKALGEVFLVMSTHPFFLSFYGIIIGLLFYAFIIMVVVPLFEFIRNLCCDIRYQSHKDFFLLSPCTIRLYGWKKAFGNAWETIYLLYFGRFFAHNDAVNLRGEL
jgi:hypothetical protein